jgi:hypothetical protein
MDVSHQSVNGGNGGNGSAPPIKGSGINHRALNKYGRGRLAAEVALGIRPFVPSHAQLAQVFNVSSHLLTQKIKALQQQQVRQQQASEQASERASERATGEAETLTAMAVELVNRLGLDGAFDLLVNATER